MLSISLRLSTSFILSKILLKTNSILKNKRGLTQLKNINFLNGVLFADIMVSGADAFLLHVTTTPSVAYVVRDLSGYQILRWDARGAGLFQRKYV